MTDPDKERAGKKRGGKYAKDSGGQPTPPASLNDPAIPAATDDKTAAANAIFASDSAATVAEGKPSGNRARGMLDHPLPDDYMEEWAEQLSLAKKEHVRGLSSAIVFRIGDELLALAAGIFREVSTELIPHKVPHRSKGSIAGMVNVGGELLPYVDLSVVLELSADAHAGAKGESFSRRVAVVQKEGKWAFPVSAMRGIQRFSIKALKEPPATVSKALRKFTRGIFDSPEGPVGYLDDELLFYTLRAEIA